MIGMTLTISIYVEKMPHLNDSSQVGMGGWQETEE
jgi:hypothetical protein